MSLYALTTALVQRLKSQAFGYKILDQNGNKKDPGVQELADILANGLSDTGNINLSSPVGFSAPQGGGPSIIIHRIVPVIGDNSGGDSFNQNINTGVIRFIDQNGNIVDVPGTGDTINSISQGGGSGSGGLTTSVTLITNCTVQVTSSGSGSINVTSCSGTVSLSITNNVVVTLTTITLTFQNGLLVGVA